METLMNSIDWLDLVLPVVIKLLEALFNLVLIPAFIAVVLWIRGWIKNALIRQIITDAIRYAQQKFLEEGGAVKLEQAIDYAIRRLEGWGITLTREQIIDFIEPILKDLKDKIGDAWYEGQTEPDDPQTFARLK